jgi:hypothetical protein
VRQRVSGAVSKAVDTSPHHGDSTITHLTCRLLAGALLLPSLACKTAEVEPKAANEAERLLVRLAEGAKITFAEQSAFPAPGAPITPPMACCEGPDTSCPGGLLLWRDEPWRSLQFSMDSPHYYRYRYQPSADGQSFVATATGDLDCDGNEVVYTIRGKVVDGQPSFSAVEKPTNRD